MKERVKILGVSVDKIRLDRLFSKTQSYLNQQACHVIYFVGMKTVFSAEGNEAFTSFLEHCDYAIVAERTMEEKIYNEKTSSSKEKMLLAQRYLERLLIRMNKNRLSLYLIGNAREEIDRLSNNLAQYYSGIQCYGSCIEEEMNEEVIDVVINDMNGVAPDVVFILLDGQSTMEFLEENRAKMNAKLCLCIGEAEEEVLQEIGLETEVPNFIKRLGLEGVYKRIFEKHNLSHTVLKKMFQKKIKQEDFEQEQDRKTEQDEK